MKSISDSIRGDALKRLPVVPTMDVVVFPEMIVPLLVVDDRITRGINSSKDSSSEVLLLAAKPESNKSGAISIEDLFSIGTVGVVMRTLDMPEGGTKALVQGKYRAEAIKIEQEDGLLTAYVKELSFTLEDQDPTELEGITKNIVELAEKLSQENKIFGPDVYPIVNKIEKPEKLADFILSHLNLDIGASQEILESRSKILLLEKTYQLLIRELEISEAQERVKDRARNSMNKSHREFYLREQLRAIREELGDDDGNDIDSMRKRWETIDAPAESKEEILKQIKRLENTAPDSADAAVTRNYLDCVLGLPWNKFTEDNIDVKRAKEILNEDHYGLDEVKERILDFISVKKLNKEGHSPILCLVGPPGTGKTSLGRSIARSLGREYLRISLGGVRDESEIRGHRRTYVGAMPGRFIQAMRKANSANPVIIIDEIDKMGSDFRGDPSSAMLEVLDPAQNVEFYDNYLGIPFDLSKVLFIATANGLDTIPEPLRDRMEIISLSGYTQDEKLEIAKKHLLEKAKREAGIPEHEGLLDERVISSVIEMYTREAGVRELERVIGRIYQKVARHYVENNAFPSVTVEALDKILGQRKFVSEEANHKNQVGVANGLAWTPMGGEMIQIEAVLMAGSGKLILTGRLGDVMKESAQAALSYVRSHSTELQIPDRIFADYDIHIHVPAGAIPKDGPSAGVTMLSAITSLLTGREIDANYAMTGEINLHGEVLPVGGIREKILSAKRNYMKAVLLPLKNQPDLSGMEKILDGIDIIWISNVQEILRLVLEDPLPDKTAATYEAFKIA